jgi:hypothetical protein
MKTLSILFALVLAACAEDSPFVNIKFEQLQFSLPDGKVIVVQKDGAVKWPKGVPSTEQVAFCDELVNEKATVADEKTTVKDAIAEWNAIVTKLAVDGKVDDTVDNAAKAQRVWKCLKKLFPHVFK